MKKYQLTLLALIGSAMVCGAHGPGHSHRNEKAGDNVKSKDLCPSAKAGETGTGSALKSGKSFKECIQEVPDKSWNATFTSAWESRHIHNGVNESGKSGAMTNEVEVFFGNLGLSAWNGLGLGNDFEEWDFSASYKFEAGPLFFTPGYNLRYAPSFGHEEEHEEEEHEEHEEHSHKLYNNELFAIIGTDAIPYVTPSTVLIWNLNDSPGGYVAFRLDGEVPICKDTFTINPYALLSLNLGYTSKDQEGWNNFEYGIQGNWRINKYLTAFAGVSYSVAMNSLTHMGQENEFWLRTGLSVGF
jgi:hypothetical protein